MDEAWQILHYMRNTQNPLVVKSNLLSYLFSSLRSDVSRATQVAHIHGAKSYRDLGIIAKFVMAITHLAVLYSIFLIFSAVLDPGAGGIRWGEEGAGPLRGRDFIFILLLLALFFGILIFFLVLFLTKLLGGKTFYSAFLSPFRWFVRLVGSLKNIFAEMGTYVVRNRGWSVLQAIVTGLEGYRFAIPLVEKSPRNVPEKLVRYIDMPKGAQQRALERRSAWVARHLGDVSQTFAKLVVTAADLTSLQRTIEVDQELVHAAYYTDDECIARIADWIAGKG